MKVIRTMNILVKTERKILMRRQTAKENIFCVRCFAQMISAQASADLLFMSSREIYRLIESGKIHFIETDQNEIYVCPLSIEKKLRSKII